MYDYLVILDMGKDYKIPIKTEAPTKINAMQKVSKWCCEEGYFANGMEVIELHSELQIVELK
jgi:hypothetical protein